MNKDYRQEDKVLFAVYGSLKKGHGNNRLLTGATYLGTQKTNANYTMYDGGFPVVEREGTTPIHVELYETNNKTTIKSVFGLEGCTGIKGHQDNWYDFDTVDTPHGEAVMFVMDKGTSNRKQIVENGIWR